MTFGDEDSREPWKSLEETDVCLTIAADLVNCQRKYAKPISDSGVQVDAFITITSITIHQHLSTLINTHHKRRWFQYVTGQ